MKERNAEQWEIDWIRSDYERLIASGTTKNIITKFRFDIAGITGLTEPQIRAITAWKLRGNGIVLKSQDFQNPSVTPEEIHIPHAVDTSFANTATNVIEDETPQPLTSVENQSENGAASKLETVFSEDSNLQKNVDIPLDPIAQSDISTTVISSDERIDIDIPIQTALVMSNEDHSETITSTNEESQDEEFGSESSNSNGEHMNYNYEIKNKWRERWGRYLLERMTEIDRRNARVLCFPGKMGIEADMYISLGFKPENLFCVEGGDADAQRCFSEEMKKRGIEPHIGRLKNVVSAKDGPFDVISLDLLGSHSRELIYSVMQIATPEKSHVLVNWMASRENQFNQTTLKMLYTRMNAMGTNFDEFCDIEDMDVDDDDIQNKSITNARELVGYNVMRKIGEAIDSYWMYKQKIHLLEVSEETKNALPPDIPEITKQNAQKHLELNLSLRMVQRGIASVLNSYSSRGSTYSAMLRNVGIQSIFGTPIVCDVERVQYQSSGKSRRIYLSDFGTIYRPIRDYSNMKHTARFLIDVAIDVANYKERSGTMTIRDKNGRKVSDNNLHRSFAISYEDSESRLSTSLKLANIHLDAERLEEIENRVGSIDCKIKDIYQSKRELIE